MKRRTKILILCLAAGVTASVFEFGLLAALWNAFEQWMWDWGLEYGGPTLGPEWPPCCEG